MRVCNLFVLPAAGEPSAAARRRHGGPERQRPRSGAEQPLLAGLGRPTRGEDAPLRRPRLSHAADKLIAVVPRRDPAGAAPASPGLRWTGRTRLTVDTRPGLRRLLAGQNGPRALRRLCLRQEVPKMACPPGPAHAAGGVASRGPRCPPGALPPPR